MEPVTLYVGLDSTQYSNGLYKDGCRKEICVAVFSTDPCCLYKIKYTRKRDVTCLGGLFEDGNSVSMVIGPEEIKVDASPLGYSAEKLVSFYLQEKFKEKIRRLELHIDGPLHTRDKRYLMTNLEKYAEIAIESHEKHFNKEKHPRKKWVKTGYYTHPRIVSAADALSNRLFRKNGLSIFANLDSRKARILPIQINGRTIEHFVLSH
ncbi:MAG TPA: hypothetical protein VJ438_02170 [Candidatus Nanoarchaeia archaeon]|nr:hypothetical protein [Candidatus Nanoarchaeia archaeon]